MTNRRIELVLSMLLYLPRKTKKASAIAYDNILISIRNSDVVINLISELKSRTIL